MTGFQALWSCASYSYWAWQGNLLMFALSTKYIIDWFLCWMPIIICVFHHTEVEKLSRVRELWAKSVGHVRKLFSIVFYFYSVDEFQHQLIKSGLTVWLWKYTYMAIYMFVCVNILYEGLLSFPNDLVCLGEAQPIILFPPLPIIFLRFSSYLSN